MKQDTLDLDKSKPGPVECLGQTFASDEVRREHYLKLLAEKLKDPEFRKIEGFPVGEDKDILALSDPPYYTACPNPWIAEFLTQPKSSKHTSQYSREPYYGDLTAQDRHPVYSFHPYHTKVPPDIIRTLIEHYTEPGDTVLDLFSGTGMTGVAARESSRRYVGSDLSTVATHISAVNNTSYQCGEAIKVLNDILIRTERELGWMYKTTEKGVDYVVNYFVWTDLFNCPECACEFPFFPHGVIHHGNKVETRKAFQCPSCKADLNVRRISRVLQYEGKKKELAWVNAGKGRARLNRQASAADRALYSTIVAQRISSWVPKDQINPDGYSAKLAQLGDKQITDITKFLSERNLMIFSSMWQKALESHPRVRNLVMATLTSIFTVISERQGYFGGGGGMSGNLYMPIVRMEKNPFQCLRRKLEKLTASEFAKPKNSPPSIITTQSSCQLKVLPNDCIDYIYSDPPFGANIIYNEMNLILEGWLRVKTSPSEDAVIDETASKDYGFYALCMRRAFAEAYRVLKPGRWITVEFHNTQACIWNLIQSSLSEVGFVVANVAKLDKGSTTILADIRPGAVVQDLIISAYKPSRQILATIRRAEPASLDIWEFVSSHLRNLPVAVVKGGLLEYIPERDPRILYDRMVAFFFCHGIPIPLSAAEFLRELSDRFPQRNGMLYLADQVGEWDKKRARMQGTGQMSIFVEDERSAIDWLRNQLKGRPATYQDLHAEFTKQLSASWKKFETRPELALLLEQNFLKYDGKGEVPSQIHSYLSTQNKDLRNLPKDDPHLQSRAKDRWFVPDPAKAVDVEAVRNKRLLQEFWELCAEAGITRVSSYSGQAALPLAPQTASKKTSRKKLKEVRTEAVRLGFKECFAAKDYATILGITAHLPENVIEEDEQLQMMHDMAEMRVRG